ncbi:TOBE domain-containing protein [Roseibium salinum]|uniref:TOBE domain-containing protein n=2 Tax=Roseibium salinum TaxID=1604349 RepID=A0ABT3QVT4_9HYPH|nr:TOBE domain-containing protein [Roseibium sp. DSM 29163]MCX2721035.1 TOBE domain-containing protein [Roseibium sp. DSM 29163]
MSFSAGAGQTIEEGARVEIFVRPEYIRTVRAAEAGKLAADGDNRMDGVIDSLLFNGANSRLLVRAGSGELVEADVTLTGENDLKSGDEVCLVWSPRQAMCFARQEIA